MKYGIHAGLWMAEWTDDLAPILGKIADLGFDGVEVSLLGMTEDRAANLGKMIADHELEATCSDGLSPAHDITSADPAVRVAGVAYLRWAIEMTARLGSRGLAGVTYAPWGQYDPARMDERLALAAESLGMLDNTLKENDIRLGIEALNRFETDLVNTAVQATALARATGSDRVGVLLDTFHMNMEEKDMASAIGDTSNHLFHFHISENDRGVPGTGHIPWDRVAHGLNAAQYDGWITAEMFITPKTPAGRDLNIWRPLAEGPDQAAQQALNFMRKTFG